MKNIFLTILVVAALPSFALAQEEAPLVQEIVVTAKSPVPNDTLAMRLSANYIVRNLNGDVVCRLKKGDVVGVVGVAPDNERVNIKVTTGPCAGVSSGFVYVNYLRPTAKEGQPTIENALVEIHGLSLRKSPSVEDGSFLCSLPRDTKVKIVGEAEKRTRWVEVEVTDAPQGCPTRGWVAANYLKPDLDLTKLHKIEGQELTEARTPKDCTDCAQGETSGGRVDPLKQVVDSGKAIQDHTIRPQGTGLPSPFGDFAKELQRTGRCPAASSSEFKCNRGLMEMPVEGNAGFCGTHHYSPDRPPGVDTYAAPHTACSLAGLAQEWKKTVCPNDNKGCRIAWGDISHKTTPRFNGHQEHTNGECIDIRPFNTGDFRDAGRNVGARDYDRETTIAFLKMAKKYGGDIMYSDSKIRGDRSTRDLTTWGGGSHKNHMHVCFEKSNATVKEACNNLRVDPAVCSELQ